MPGARRAAARSARTSAGNGSRHIGLCAAQAATALVALLAAGAGWSIIDPIAALIISAIAIKECAALWNGDSDDCCAPLGFDTTADACDDGCCS